MKRRSAMVLLPVLALAVALTGVTASAASASRKADVALARKALVVKSDFPAGWTTSSNGGNANKNLGIPQLLACLGLPASLVNFNPPEADSPTFNQNTYGQTVDDSVDVFSSVKIANEALKMYGSPDSAKCLAQSFNTPSVKTVFARGLGKGAVVGTAQVTALPKPVANNASTALLLRLPFTYQGHHIVLESEDVVIMSKSLTVGSALVFSGLIQAPVPSSIVKHLEAVTVQRLG